MNIFYLNENIELNAQQHCDRHVLKMVIEQNQLLSAAHWMSGSEAPYKLTHKNHPCSIWTRASLSNYIWLCKSTLALCREYTFRYGKIHKCEEVAKWHLNNLPSIKNIGLTERPLCMPDEFKLSSDMESYRQYYRVGKAHIHAWKNREIPEWI